MEVFWYNADTNFGDLLTPYIFKAYGLKVKYTPPTKCKVMGIGSILESSNKMKNKNGIIWTSGAKHETSKFNMNTFNVIGVRGHLTRKACKLDGKKVMVGDGGLIVKESYEKYGKTLPTIKKYELGIIPHYVDYKYVSQKSPIAKHPNVKIIRILDPIEKVIEESSQCKCIISSSLHGLILSDSLGIPNRQFRCPTSNKIQGKLYKFRDHYSAFGIDAPTPISINISSKDPSIYIDSCFPYVRPGLDQIKIDLINSLKTVRELYRKISNKTTNKVAKNTQNSRGFLKNQNQKKKIKARKYKSVSAIRKIKTSKMILKRRSLAKKNKS